MTSEFLEQLFLIVGQKGLITECADMEPFLCEPRGLFHGAAKCVVRPSTTEQTAAVLHLCNVLGVGVVPQGGNTGLVGGQVPNESGEQVLLSLQRMTAIRNLDPTSNTITIEAGATIADVQEAAASVDRYFPLSYASEGTATVGGAMSTNAGGIHVLAYGSACDLMLGVEVALADGRIFPGLSKLRKDNTGYHLSRLFVGSEGTLGIITAATLKIFPRPRAYATALVAVESPKEALELLHLARECLGASLHAFELIPRLGLDLVIDYNVGLRQPYKKCYPWHVLLESAVFDYTSATDAVEAFLEKALDAGLSCDATIAASLQQRSDFWRFREMLPEVQGRYGAVLKHDISLPLENVPVFLAIVGDMVAQAFPGARPIPFGHLGDGNIHYNVLQPLNGDREAFLARSEELSEIVNSIVLSHGGSVSAEHGVGQLKRDLLSKIKDPVSLDIMTAIKSLFDPKQIMNPGKVLKERI